MKAVEIQNMSFSYGHSLVLDQVSFTIQEGDFVGIIGPNGGGKTTLMKLMLGLLKPQKGTIKLLGKKVPHPKASVGYVPQNTSHNIDFPITVEECVALGFLNQKKDPKLISWALEQVHMQDYRFKRLGELSGGERQRIFIARALVSSPRIMLLDEPSSNIDVGGQEQLFKLLEELNQQMTVVVVSHDLMVLSNRIKSVVCVNKTAHHHPEREVTSEMMRKMYGCEVDLIAHGIPHRVFAEHHS